MSLHYCFFFWLITELKWFLFFFIIFIVKYQKTKEERKEKKKGAGEGRKMAETEGKIKAGNKMAS